MRQSVIKDGKVTDQLMYAILREECTVAADEVST